MAGSWPQPGIEPGVRTLPLRVAPVDGEALDSWLEALAARMSASWGEVVNSVGLSSTASGIPRNCVVRWLRGLSESEILAVSAATGVAAWRLAESTFGGLQARLTDQPGLRGSSVESLLWMREGRSRFCPACLSESGGRWLLWWRLRWAFACPFHACLLADVCPTCQRPQRATIAPAELIPIPGRCTRKHRGAHGRDITRCGGELTGSVGVALFDGHPAVDAQRAVLATLTSDIADFGVYRNAPVSFPESIADIAALGGRVLRYATSAELHQILPNDLVDRYLLDRGDPAKVRPSRITATTTAETAAVGATAAWSILSAPTVDEAGARLGWLIDSNRGSGVAVRPSTIGWGRGISPVLREVQLAALGPLMTPVRQLRRRSTGTAVESAAAHSRAARLPTLLWPCWSLPLRRRGLGHRELRAAISAAIAVVGTRTSLVDLIGQLGSATTERRTSRVLHLLHASPHWEWIRSAITAWAAYLDAHQPPIDYQRRRGLACEGLLPTEAWRELSLPTGVGSGRGIRLKLLRCWLFERLTTLPAERSPWAADSAEFRSKLGAMPLWLTAELVTALDEYGWQFLAANGIHEEPVLWNPLWIGQHFGVVADAPGVDVAEMHRWIGKHRPRSFASLANRFALDVDTARYLLQESPTPEALLGRGSSSAPRAIRSLSRQQFDHLYNERRWSLAAIAAEAGVSRHAVTDLAHRYGITVRRVGRQTVR